MGALANFLTEVGRLQAEVTRLQALVGEEVFDGADQWRNCDRREAIRQADEFHAGLREWGDRFYAMRDERDALAAALASRTHEKVPPDPDLGCVCCATADDPVHRTPRVVLARAGREVTG